MKQWILPVHTYVTGKEPTPSVQLWTVRAVSIDGPVLCLKREGGDWGRSYFLTEIEDENDDRILWRPIVVFAVEKCDPSLWGWDRT